MLKKWKVGPTTMKVTFELPSEIDPNLTAAPNAEGIKEPVVELVGTFSDWQPVTMYLVNNKWQVTLDLPTGETHDYQFIVNGQRNNDWDCDGYSPRWDCNQEFSVLRTTIEVVDDGALPLAAQ